MEIAAQHAKGQHVAARQQMRKGFLLDWVDLHSGYVAPGHAQFAGLVETHVADAAPPGRMRQ